jgi:hypothetical protein
LYSRNKRLSKNAGLNFNLTNFINFKTKLNETDDLIAKGRKVIGGKIGLENTSIIPNPFADGARRIQDIHLSAEYGQFVKDGLLLGIKTANFHTDVEGYFNYKESNIILTSYAQYFYPINKRLMVQGNLEVGYTFLGYKDRPIFHTGLGLAYFISKNIAVNVDVLSYSNYKETSATRETNLFGSQARLLFFIK